MLTKFQANRVWQKRAVSVFYWDQMKKSASSLTIQVIICESKVRACKRWPPVLRWLLLADEFTKCVIFYILSHQKYIIIKECFYLCLLYFGLGKMHLNHFIRKWITAIFTQISLVMLVVSLPTSKVFLFVGLKFYISICVSLYLCIYLSNLYTLTVYLLELLA